jgi:hypothetical protein
MRAYQKPRKSPASPDKASDASRNGAPAPLSPTPTGAPTQGSTDNSKEESLSATDVLARATPVDTRPPVTLSRPKQTTTITAISRDKGSTGSGLPLELLKKIALLIGLVAASRVGVYDRLPGVDVARFSEAVSSNGLLGYIDSITGGSISNVGVFSLGIIPAINASIFLQIMTISFPGLKKLQREEGPQGRARYQLYQKLATLGFAAAQAFGQLSAIK